MKRGILLFLFLLFAFGATAQDESPTVNWPYLNPDFVEGEMIQVGGKKVSGVFNIHLGRGALHFVTDGVISEASAAEILSVTIGNEEFTNVGGKIMKVLARSESGFVVEEKLADYSAVVRNDGAYGGALSNAAKGFSYDENYVNYGYLVTDKYEDLYSIKNQAEELPVTVKRYLMLDGIPVLATRKNVSDLENIDKKDLSNFLKVEKID